MRILERKFAKKKKRSCVFVSIVGVGVCVVQCVAPTSPKAAETTRATMSGLCSASTRDVRSTAAVGADRLMPIAATNAAALESAAEPGEDD